MANICGLVERFDGLRNMVIVGRKQKQKMESSIGTSYYLVLSNVLRRDLKRCVYFKKKTF